MPHNIPEPIKLDTPLRARIHRRLGLVGEGPQAFYRDALRLMDGVRVESTSHLVGHLLREIESALRDVLEPITHYEAQIRGKSDTAHEQEVRIILRELGMNADEGAGAAWLEIVRTGLHGLAHRRSLERPRPFDEQFRALWAEVEGVLDTVLERFESRYLDLHGEVDRLLTKATPSKADLKYLRDYLPNNPVTRHYFFTSLKHAGWLRPLVEAGFLSDPPPAITDAQAQTITHPIWPVTEYLKRMSSIQECHQAVADILRDIPETDNRVVHDALADVLLQLPPEYSVALVDRVARWVANDVFTLLAVKAGELAVRLLAADYKDAAFLLLHAVLDPGRFPPGDSRRSRPVDTYGYSQVLEKSLPEFSRRWPHETLQLLGDLLAQGIRATESDQDGALYSSVWRRSIEKAQPWRRYDIVDLLVDAVRDASLAIRRAHPEEMRHIAGALEKRELGIFRRIALYVLSTAPTTAPDLVEERLRRRDLFDAWHQEREYVRLLELSFAHLTPEARAEILGWIEQGPPPGRYAARDAEESQEITRRWQEARLRPLIGKLPPEWELRLGPLGSVPPSAEDLNEDEGGWVGPTSPRSSEDLRALAADDLIELLKSWRPKPGWHESSPEGLGRALTEALGKDPVWLAEHARLFQGLEPTYVGAVVRGFQEALNSGNPFGWSGVLDLCEWIVEQSRQDEREPSDANPGWSWCRRAVTSLIAKGVDSQANPIPVEARDQVWRILEPVTWDPDPTPNRDADRSDDDAFHVAINSVRGEAMNAVIRYAVWLEKHLRATNAPKTGLAAMPEVERNLSEHLDISRESSPAVRSVFGETFPALHWIDADWARQHVDLVFAEPRGSNVPRAAWITYLRFTRPFDELFPLLEGLYRGAVNDLDPTSTTKSDIDSVEHHLGMHLMSFLWRGVTTADAMGRDFLLRGGTSLRHAALEFMGRSLMSRESDVSGESLARLRALWEWWRGEATRLGLLGKELEAFGWWLGSGKCETAWAIDQAFWVLDTGASLEPDHLVAKYLEELVPAEPRAAVRILDGLWENVRDPWSFYGWRDECRGVLKTALAARDAEAVRIATALINKLAARGHLEFRSLLSNAS